MINKIVKVTYNYLAKNPRLIFAIVGSIKDAYIDYRISQTRKKLKAMQKIYSAEHKTRTKQEAKKILLQIQQYIAGHNLGDEKTIQLNRKLLAGNEWVNYE